MRDVQDIMFFFNQSYDFIKEMIKKHKIKTILLLIFIGLFTILKKRKNNNNKNNSNLDYSNVDYKTDVRSKISIRKPLFNFLSFLGIIAVSMCVILFMFVAFVGKLIFYVP